MQEVFQDTCDGFYAAYSAAKTNFSRSGIIATFARQPIEDELSLVDGLNCKAGCFFCCHLRVEVFPHEVVAIYLYLNDKLERDELSGLKSRIENVYSKISLMTQAEHFADNLPCPLLSNGKCQVYPVRPINCAGHHSLSVEQCEKSFNNPEVLEGEQTTIPMDAGVKIRQDMMAGAMKTVIETFGDDTNRYELVFALHHVFKNPSSIQKWRKGRLLIKS